MNKKIKYLIAFLIVAGVLIFLLFTTFQSSLQYYVTVSELRGTENSYQDKILKVAGNAKNIRRLEKVEGLTYRFDVNEGGESLKVTYSGVAPDTFKEDANVVVTGHLNPDGVFEADEILAKCASKYEAKLDE